MSTADTAFKALVAANPIPAGGEPHPQAWSETALLHEIDTRSRAKSAGVPKQSRRTALLVAAAAFIVLLTAIGIAAFVAGGGDNVVDVPPSTVVPTTSPSTTQSPATTQPPETTTTAAATTTTLPPIDAADQAVIDEFVATFNSGDAEAVLASLTLDALVWADILAADPVVLSESADLIGDWLAYTAIPQTEIDLSSCEPFSEGRINCTGTYTDDVVRQSPLGPAGVSVTFAVEPEGTVSYFFVRVNGAAMNAGYVPFIAWLDATYPEENPLLFGGNGLVRFDDQARELWAIRVPEWLATLES